ncbi:unnamed protein product [Kuraishia capsulata CBS 1993]|uniref:Ribosome biogenesis protein RLP7 n=1 Tax=Kuraishia capsulata CBS 1993 TaxID=1382522 RepID=W6MQV2_9ASCO|nr:uncharacterized protein KUCA_T00005038001 [Kuraishia capsulata CBS 1993]CDK29051.1 unnamed protein product [Kuraishia capsulata CBS 1993]
MSSVTEPLNSNPEILLRKRKNADRLRIEKQEAARKKEQDKESRRKLRAKKFVRAETLVAKHRASEREDYRVKRVIKNEKETLLNAPKSIEDDEEKAELQFIVRIRGPHGAKVPAKAKKILSLLRLDHINTGVFIKSTKLVRPLLRIISPYTVLGKPSLATIRNLIQKRATIELDGREVNLNDNAVVEEQLGEFGIVCVEDIIHEVATMGEAFKPVIGFMKPFQLTSPAQGWNALSKFKRLELREESNKRKISTAGNAPLEEVDIDTFIAEQV